MTEVKRIHKNIIIIGRVQGVGFRYAAKKMALSLGISGFVQNLSNGNVYLEAEGSEIQLKHMIDWCYSGPSYAFIEEVQISDSEILNYITFDIQH
jgi:acylphosphatase